MFYIILQIPLSFSGVIGYNGLRNKAGGENLTALEIILEILGWIAKIITGYTAIMSIFFLLPRKKYAPASPKTRFAVLIPARNEENVIGTLVESLQKQDYPSELYDIIVIPNNCTDDTEGVALRAGAKVLQCPGKVKTKGQVLHKIFRILSGQYDAYCVLDADNVVNTHFLSAMNDAIAAGAKVAKSRQCALNPYDNWVSGAYDLYFQSINLLYSRARAPFRLSAKLVGTGFMVTDSLLQKLGGWNTKTLTEDIEFACLSAMAGERVYYVPDAVNYDEEPTSFALSMRQRHRWSAGVQSVANHYALRLFFMRPSWLRWDLAIHILAIYAQLIALLPVLYSLVTQGLVGALITLGVALGGFVLGGIAMGLLLCLTAGRDLKKQWRAVLLYPIYLGSWYPLHVWALFAKPRTWKPIAHGNAKIRQK